MPYENSTQSWNRFSYCRNNPIIYHDPTGHRDLAKGQEPVNRSTDGASSFIRSQDLKTDATKLVNSMIDKAVKDCKNLTGGARLKGVVENLTKQFESVKYKSEDQLAYTYGTLMQRMGKEFGAGPNHIGYAQSDKTLYQNGKLTERSAIDCTYYQTLGINILGLTKPGGENVNEREGKWDKNGKFTGKYYNYNDSSYANGPKNFADNTSIFRKYNGSDRTGTIGLITGSGGYDHAFTSLNSNASSISESRPDAGIINESSSRVTNAYKSDFKAEFYRLRLPDWKKE